MTVHGTTIRAMHMLVALGVLVALAGCAGPEIKLTGCLDGQAEIARTQDVAPPNCMAP